MATVRAAVNRTIARRRGLLLGFAALAALTATLLTSASAVSAQTTETQTVEVGVTVTNELTVTVDINTGSGTTTGQTAQATTYQRTISPNNTPTTMGLLTATVWVSLTRPQDVTVVASYRADGVTLCGALVRSERCPSVHAPTDLQRNMVGFVYSDSCNGTLSDCSRNASVYKRAPSAVNNVVALSEPGGDFPPQRPHLCMYVAAGALPTTPTVTVAEPCIAVSVGNIDPTGAVQQAGFTQWLQTFTGVYNADFNVRLDQGASTFALSPLGVDVFRREIPRFTEVFNTVLPPQVRSLRADQASEQRDDTSGLLTYLNAQTGDLLSPLRHASDLLAFPDFQLFSSLLVVALVLMLLGGLTMLKVSGHVSAAAILTLLMPALFIAPVAVFVMLVMFTVLVAVSAIKWYQRTIPT